MKIADVLGEANLSRRGFLKGLGAAAATAAVPGLGQVAPMTAAAATTAPAAAAGTSALAALFDTAAAYGLDRGWLGHVYPGDVDPEDYEADPELMQPQGSEGEMPWGEAYELRKTPSGKEYIATSGPYGDSAVYTYYKDGQIRNIEIAWERDGYGEVLGSEDQADSNAYYDYTDEHGDLTQDNEGAVIDAIINGYSGSGGDSGEEEIQQKSWGPTPSELARLAGLAKTGMNTADADAATSVTPQTAPAPQALPAPTAPDVLEPELNKEKQAVPAKK